MTQAFVPSIFSVMTMSRNRRGIFGQALNSGILNLRHATISVNHCHDSANSLEKDLEVIHETNRRRIKRRRHRPAVINDHVVVLLLDHLIPVHILDPQLSLGAHDGADSQLGELLARLLDPLQTRGSERSPDTSVGSHQHPVVRLAIYGSIPTPEVRQLCVRTATRSTGRRRVIANANPVAFLELELSHPPSPSQSHTTAR